MFIDFILSLHVLIVRTNLTYDALNSYYNNILNIDSYYIYKTIDKKTTVHYCTVVFVIKISYYMLLAIDMYLNKCNNVFKWVFFRRYVFHYLH